jgi:SMI1 / KNR4 family (SUKH-1)
MSILDELQKARSTSYSTKGGKPLSPDFLPGLSEEKLRQIEAALGATLPDDFRELAMQCGGIEGFEFKIDFTGSHGFGMEEIFPKCHAIAADGCGNFWIIDATSRQESTAQVFYACHDAPVILYQCGSMSEFLAELIKLHTPPHQSLLNDVPTDQLYKVWRTNPGTIEHATALNSSDATIRSFAATLDERFLIVDLRFPQPGMGFSWGRFGPRTELRRCGEEHIFAYAQPSKQPGFLSRLFGKT